MRVGVIGAGTMGAGIAELARGIGDVVVYDPDPGRGETTDLGALEGCDLIVEAAPEDLSLKRELFAAITHDCVLATNTSSLSVTEIAGGDPRVVGLHFFNPAPKMRLVEVIRGAATSDHAYAVARAAAEAMGKRVVDAPDSVGFLVNRVNRPFSLEGLKLLEEGIATPEVIDRALRLGAGFRMGPFELMDLVGIDVNHAVAEVFHRASYGEPRYRPSPLAARKVAAGTLGRKTGAGWYAYPPGRPEDPSPPAPTTEDLDAALAGTRARLLRDGSLHALDPEAVGYFVLPPYGRLMEITTTDRTDPVAVERLEQAAAALGMVTVHVGDAPGLICGRVVCQLINEACFLLDATPEDVDAGMELGVAHPRGPYAWLELIGPANVVATLDALHRELGEPRYRVAPRLRRAATTGRVA